MKELKEEAKRHAAHKLRSYGGEARAHGGRVEHDDKKEDEKLIHKEVKPEALKHGVSHKAGGGPILGGGKLPSLGRRRSGPGKSKGTNVNIALGKPGSDAAGPLPGPLPGPAIMPPPRPAGPPMPPRPIGVPPGGPAGPMKRGGHVKKHHGGHKEARR